MLDDMKIRTVEDNDMTSGTAGEVLVRADEISATAVQLTEDIGLNRGIARELHQTADDLHNRSHFVEWTHRTTVEAKKSVGSLLEHLSELGFSWRDIARMIGVSVPALRKWRTGGGSTGKNRQDLAALSAACALITEHYMIEEVASWFEVPLLPGVAVTPIDLYASGNPKLVFDFASGHVTPESVLDEYDSSWRDQLNTNYETFVAEDGRLAIRPRD